MLTVTVSIVTKAELIELNLTKLNILNSILMEQFHLISIEAVSIVLAKVFTQLGIFC